MDRHYTCVICPNGCDILARTLADGIQISGEGCARGREYVLREMTDPRRTISTSVRIVGGNCPLLSVRLTQPIPRDRVRDAVEVIHKLHPNAPIEIGTVLISGIFDTDSDVIATRTVKAIDTPHSATNQ